MHVRGLPRAGLRPLALAGAALALGGGGLAIASNHGSDSSGQIGPTSYMTANGRHLTPAGRMTTVGNFPTGGTLSPDGRFYWAVDAGHGANGVDIVDVASGKVVETLPLPGASGGIAFAPDGRTAYVSGEPKSGATPLDPTGRGGPVPPPQEEGGDAIHIFSVDATTGRATEGNGIQLPATTGGRAQQADGSPVGWPQGLAVTPDGKTLVAALNHADQVAIIDVATGQSRLVKVGTFPYGLAIDRSGRTAYVTNEYDGTVSVVDIASGAQTRTIQVGGSSNPDGSADPNRNAHPEGIVTDPQRDQAYVAVTNRDAVAIIDTASGAVSHYVSVAREAGLGASPVSVREAPDGRTLYAADAGEDAVAAISLVPRGRQLDHRHVDEGDHGHAGDKGLGAFELIGKIPTAAYTTDVAVTPDGRRLVWLAGKGLGAGPNPKFGEHFGDSGSAPADQYVMNMLLGRVGVLPVPDDRQVAEMSRFADRQVVPADAAGAPRGTPLRPNGPIKHVFFIVRENRTYDQVLGSDRRGDGDPTLELVDDNGVAGPTGGVTPNAHALTRMFPLLDHVYADSEVSEDGHKITAGGYATDFVQRNTAASYANRAVNVSKESAANPPRDYLFDQAIRQGLTFHNYGEKAAGLGADDGRPTYGQSLAGVDAAYPVGIGCKKAPASPANCSQDSGTVGHGAGQDASNSRFDAFEQRFGQQLATNSVPGLNYLTVGNDHTQGTKPGFLTPRAMIADNDYGLGQMVQLISHSPIWSSSAIFVVEDDCQNGGDHVDAHRIPAFVISPWTRHDAVVHTRYDQDSVLRSMEMILGLKPLSLHDGLAAPMYDAFTSTPDLTPFTAVKPDYPLDATNSATAPDAKLSNAMPFTTMDAVPQEVSDRIAWDSVFGARARVPHAGPNASPAEHDRARAAMSVYHRGGGSRQLRARLRTLLKGADRKDG
jgi:YVTN family beta-propeller protein